MITEKIDARPNSKVKGQGANMIGVVDYSQDDVYNNPSQIDGADPSVDDNKQGMGMRNSSLYQGQAQGDD